MEKDLSQFPKANAYLKERFEALSEPPEGSLLTEGDYPDVSTPWRKLMFMLDMFDEVRDAIYDKNRQASKQFKDEMVDRELLFYYAELEKALTVLESL